MKEIDIKIYYKLTNSDFPAAFRSADRASVNSQKAYLLLVRLDLLLLLIGAIVTSWAIESDTSRTLLAIIGAIALGLGSLLTLAMKVTEYDKTWFGARAIAESIKTLAWRYMTKAAPYVHSLASAKVDEMFCSEIAKILKERSSLAFALASAEAASDQITDRMREVRNQSINDRKALYLRDRIKDQQTWYAAKGASSKDSATKWLFTVSICQAIAFIAAILLIKFPEFNLNIASILSTLAAIFLSWLQVKRHQDLAQSYGLATHELGLIYSQERHVVSDDDLSKFVMDAENAISREHTMWLARRDTI